MEIQELCKQLQAKLDKLLPAHIFLDKFRMIEEGARKTGTYSDPRYIPFYYWLGTLIQPKSFLEIGFRLGLTSGTFLSSCKTAEKFVGFQEKSGEFYSPRLGISNIKDVYKGDMNVYVGTLLDIDFNEALSGNKWDLAIINEERSYDRHKDYLEFVWQQISPDGLITMDYVTRHSPANQAYLDFCKLKNREPVIVDTRYGVGMLQK